MLVASCPVVDIEREESHMWRFCVVLFLLNVAGWLSGCAPLPPEPDVSATFIPSPPAHSPLASPTAVTTWSAVYGGQGFEEVEGLLVTDDGSLILTGATNSYSDDEQGDAWILNLHGDGRVAWQRLYGSNGEDNIVDIRQTADGGFVAVGMTDSFGAGQEDLWVLRLDAQGDVMWSKTYGGPGVEQGWAVDLAPGGGYVVAGATTSFGAGGADYWVLRLNRDGSVRWQRTLGGLQDDGGASAYGEFVVRVLVDRDGNFVLASETLSFARGESDIWIVKLDSNGEILWQRAYGGEYEDSLWTFAEAAGGGYILAGVTVSYSPDASGDTWVLRLNTDGSVRWQKVFGLQGDWDEALTVGATRDGGALVGAYAEEGQADWDMVLLRVNEQGNLVWQRRYEYGWDWPTAVAEMPDGSLALAGVAWDKERGQDLDLWVMRLAADGTVGADCPVVQDVQFEVRTTANAPVETSAVVQDTSVAPRVAPITVRASSATPRYLCPAPTG